MKAGGHWGQASPQKLMIRKQIRLKNFDYSEDGWYYVTICSNNRKNIFGKIINNNPVGADGCRPDNNIQIQLNEFGLIIDDELKKSEYIRNEINLDHYVSMPNHLHAIIVIQHNLMDKQIITGGRIIPGGQPSAPTGNIKYKQTLSSFVAGFKSALTKRINILRNTPGEPIWQRSFYDYVIRNDKSLNKIKELKTGC